LLGIFITFGAVLLAGLFFKRINSQDVPMQLNEPSLLLSLGLAALEALALIGGVYWLGMRRRGLNWRAIGLRVCSRNWLLTALAIGLIIIPLSGLIATLIMLLLGRPFENPQLDFLVPEGFSWSGAVGMLLLGGIVVPFAEELFFRGFLYNFLRERWGIWTGTLISAGVFGAAHGDLALAGAAFVMGIILALVYEYSRSLWAAVLIHLINNSAKIALLYALLALGVKDLLT
jgi:membrane protease YdiL (CAAX protease family)